MRGGDVAHTQTHTQWHTHEKSSASSPWFDCCPDYTFIDGIVDQKMYTVAKVGKPEKVAERQT